jgi:hypothetical protein
MIDTLFDIPYKIIEEDVEIDCGSFVIHRTYELPKSLFKSSNDYLDIIQKYDGKVISQDGLKVFIYTTGWRDANCKSYGIMIIIKPEESF